METMNFNYRMTRMDIKNYLEKIYGVKVDSVRTLIKLSKIACY